MLRKLIYRILNPRWIMSTDEGNLGIRIWGINLFYYKRWKPLMYEKGSDPPIRIIQEKEFGSVITPRPSEWRDSTGPLKFDYPSDLFTDEAQLAGLRRLCKSLLTEVMHGYEANGFTQGETSLPEWTRTAERLGVEIPQSDEPQPPKISKDWILRKAKEEEELDITAGNLSRKTS